MCIVKNWVPISNSANIMMVCAVPGPDNRKFEDPQGLCCFAHQAEIQFWRWWMRCAHFPSQSLALVVQFCQVLARCYHLPSESAPTTLIKTLLIQQNFVNPSPPARYLEHEHVPGLKATTIFGEDYYSDVTEQLSSHLSFTGEVVALPPFLKRAAANSGMLSGAG